MHLFSPPAGSSQFSVGQLGGAEDGVQVQGAWSGQLHQAVEGERTLSGLFTLFDPRIQQDQRI